MTKIKYLLPVLFLSQFAFGEAEVSYEEKVNSSNPPASSERWAEENMQHCASWDTSAIYMKDTKTIFLEESEYGLSFSMKDVDENGFYTLNGLNETTRNDIISVDPERGPNLVMSTLIDADKNSAVSLAAGQSNVTNGEDLWNMIKEESFVKEARESAESENELWQHYKGSEIVDIAKDFAKMEFEVLKYDGQQLVLSFVGSDSDEPVELDCH